MLCPKSLRKKSFKNTKAVFNVLKKTVIEPDSVTNSINLANYIRKPPNAGSDASKFSPTRWNLSTNVLI